MTTLTFRSLPANDLASVQLGAWSELQRDHAELRNPHFCPGFTTCTAAVRDRVEVIVIMRGAEIAGFVPWRRDRSGGSTAIAGAFSGRQGAIARPDVTWDLRQLLRDCRLPVLHFQNVPAEQTAFQSFQAETVQSPFMDLGHGFESFRRARKQSGSQHFHTALRKVRKLERDHGPIHLETDCRDPRVFETLVRWKTEQLEAMQLRNCFQPPWVLPLLEKIWSHVVDGFGGQLAALWADDALAAAAFGLRTGQVFHGWVPAYNPALGKCSPGSVMDVLLAEALAAEGVDRIEMGAGPETYKRGFASCANTVLRGAADQHTVRAVVRRRARQARAWLRDSRFAPIARRLIRTFQISRIRGFA